MLNTGMVVGRSATLLNRRHQRIFSAPARRLCQAKDSEDSKLSTDEALWTIPLHSTALPCGDRSPNFDVSCLSQSPISGPFRGGLEREEQRTVKTARKTRKRGKSAAAAEVRREGLVCKKYNFQPPGANTQDEVPCTGSTKDTDDDKGQRQKGVSLDFGYPEERMQGSKESNNSHKEESNNQRNLEKSDLSIRDVLEISPRLIVIKKGSQTLALHGDARTPLTKDANITSNLGIRKSRTEYPIKLSREVGSPLARSLNVNNTSQLVIKGKPASQYGRPGSRGDSTQSLQPNRCCRNSTGRRSLEIPESLRREALRRRSRSSSSHGIAAHHQISVENIPVASPTVRPTIAAPLTSSGIDDNSARLVVDLSAVPSFADISDDVELRPRSLSKFVNSDEITPHMEEFTPNATELQLLHSSAVRENSFMLETKSIGEKFKRSHHHSSPLSGHSNIENLSPDESMIQHYSNIKPVNGSTARQLRFAVATSSAEPPRLLLTHINKSLHAKSGEHSNLNIRFSTGAVRMPPLSSTTVLLPSARVE